MVRGPGKLVPSPCNHLVAYSRLVDKMFKVPADSARRLTLDTPADSDEPTLYHQKVRWGNKHIVILKDGSLVKLSRSGRF